MLTLLMCATFLCNASSPAKVQLALQYFEAGRTMYLLTLGSQNPMIGVHICALADLYFAAKAYSQAKVATMIAKSTFQSILGDLHPVCAGIGCKLGNLLLAEGQYGAAVEIFEAAFNIYQHINRLSPQTNGESHIYADDEGHCLHGLAIGLKGKGEIVYAMQCAILSVDIATSENRPMTPGVVHTLFLLAEMYEMTSDLYTAASLYQDVWNIIKCSPHMFPMSQILKDLAARLVRVIVAMLPLQSRTLIETILAGTPSPSKQEWKITVNSLCAEMWLYEPVEYIKELIKSALQGAGETGFIYFNIKE